MAKVSMMGVSEIRSMIIELRGKKVILDRDLAMLYQVTTKTINQAVRRNFERFPSDFVFQLTQEEWEFLRSQIVTAKSDARKVRYLPYAFTRNGANMISAVLKSPVAIQRSVQIMRAFSALEEAISNNRHKLTQSPEAMRQLSIHSKAIMSLFQETKFNGKEIKKVKKIQKAMIDLLQQIVFASLEKN